MKVAPPTRHSIVSDTPDGLKITIPAKRNIVLVLFLSAWLVGWAMGEAFAIRQLLRADAVAPSLFMAAWLVGWTIGGGFALYLCVWNAMGKEIVYLGPGVLATKHDLLGFGRTREYDLSHVKNLRVTPQVQDPFGWSSGMRAWGVSAGTVAFDYGAKTFRFGAAIDEAEGAQIVDELKARHSFGSAA